MTLSVNKILARVAERTRHKIGVIGNRYEQCWLQYFTVCEHCDIEIVLHTRDQTISINNMVLAYKADSKNWRHLVSVQESFLCARIRNLL